jgi:UPF0716 family protein affecting phage T7 exclusion
MFEIVALGAGAMTLASLCLYIFVGGWIGAFGLIQVIIFTFVTVLIVNAGRNFNGKDAEERRISGYED